MRLVPRNLFKSRRWWMALFCAAGMAGSTASLAEPQLRDIVEHSFVDVVESWPLVVRGKRSDDDDHCRSLGPESFRVTENNQEVRVVSVASAPGLTSQVLLVDTSSSMTNKGRVISRRRGRQAKAVGRAYVRWVIGNAKDTDGEAAPELMLFTFDDDLIMQVPPTSIVNATAKSDAYEAIRNISGGYMTGLNDSVHHVINYLRDREGRAVVILLSDGADSGGVRAAIDVEHLAQRADNVTLFAIGIGLHGSQHEKFVEFLERLARSTGGRFFAVRGSAAEMAERVEDRFDDIQVRLRSQVYLSWLTSVSADRVDEVRIRIRSRDPRCLVPADGYRPLRISDSDPSQDVAATDKTPGERPALEAPARLALEVSDLVLDGDPLIRYAGDPGQAVRDTRRVQLDLGALADLRSAEPGLAPIIYDWVVTGRLPLRARAGTIPDARENDFPMAGEINGRSFLELRDDFAAVINGSHGPLRDWARSRAETRVRSRFARLTSPPHEPDARRRFDSRLSSVIQGRIDSMGPRAFRDDLAGWLGDVTARELSDGIERLAANRLLRDAQGTAGDTDRLQANWVRLYDWLGVPDRVRVTVPLSLVCTGSSGPCGFIRIILPRVGDLPEDLNQTTGKILRPATFEQYVDYERNRVPRWPVGLMLLRKLVLSDPGSNPAAGSLSAELRAGWGVNAVRHVPERAGRPGNPTAPRCVRRVTLELQRDARSVQLEMKVAVQPYSGASADVRPEACDTLPDPVDLTPLCYRVEGDAKTELKRLLDQAGFVSCVARASS